MSYVLKYMFQQLLVILIFLIICGFDSLAGSASYTIGLWNVYPLKDGKHIFQAMRKNLKVIAVASKNRISEEGIESVQIFQILLPEFNKPRFDLLKRSLFPQKDMKTISEGAVKLKLGKIYFIQQQYQKGSQSQIISLFVREDETGVMGFYYETKARRYFKNKDQFEKLVRGVKLKTLEAKL